MSGGRVAGLEEVRERVRASSVRLGRVLFGDRVGFVVFLAAVLWCVALWRIGIFITDTLTVANALANVADGHLAIRQTPYSLTIGSQPGIVQVGDTVFGRNYGHVLLAVPLVWLLEGLSLLFEPRVLLAGGWSLGLIVLAVQLKRLTGNAAVATVGSGLALVVFLANVAVATPVPEALLALIGLQLSTILVAGLLASTMYRLVTRFHGRRVGVVAGVAVLVATPVGFWASIPKRHLITATVAVVALFCFAVSRDGTGKRQLRARILSYVVIGLLTTVHPFEAFFLFVVLVPLDLLTAPSNRPRAVLAVAGVFFLSLLPFFVLNTLISGNPVKSPRLLSGYAGSLDVPTPTPPDEGGASGSGGGSSGETGSTGGSGASGSGTGGSATGGASGTGGSGSTSSGILAVVASYLAGFVSGMIGFVGEVVGLVSGMVGFTVSVAEYAVGWVDQSLAVLSEPDRLSQTFVRSGQLPSASLAANDFEAVELTLLESFPLVAAFVWLPVSVVEHLRTAVADAGVTSPAQQTDLLAGGFAVVFYAGLPAAAPAAHTGYTEIYPASDATLAVRTHPAVGGQRDDCVGSEVVRRKLPHAGRRRERAVRGRSHARRPGNRRSDAVARTGRTGNRGTGSGGVRLLADTHRQTGPRRWPLTPGGGDDHLPAVQSNRVFQLPDAECDRPLGAIRTGRGAGAWRALAGVSGVSGIGRAPTPSIEYQRR